jgi:DNA-directed RNA polymerase sigma subunit (sigma70/sigma32)
MSVNTVGEIAARISMLQPKRSLSTADARNLEERSMARATKKPEEVGRFNVTRERIRQIEANALAKLKDPSRNLKVKAWLAKNIRPSGSA